MQVFERLQLSLHDTKMKLKYKRDGKEKTCVLQPTDSDEWYVPDRGLRLAGLSEIHKAASVGEACALGYRNTVESLLHVFKFLRKLCT